MESTLEIREPDWDRPGDCAAVIEVLDSYASDPVGGGQPLSDDVCRRLIPALREHPTTLVLLAFEQSQAIGLAICFFGLSTFQARPLLNIHDLAVVPAHRRRGVGRALLRAVEERARQRGCCKLTLEVQDDNRHARGLYQSFGFTDFVLSQPVSTRFLSKQL